MRGWEKRTLGSIVEIRGGGTPSKRIPQYWNGDIPWVSPKDMKARIIDDSIDRITEEAVSKSAVRLIPRDAILMVVRSGILARTVPLARANRELTVNQDLKALCPSRLIDPGFLLYFMEAIEPVLLKKVTRGATVHRLTTDVIKSILIPLPPLAEQRRIVALLDEAFEGIDRAIANTEKNLANARELFESYLNRVFIEKGDGWVERKLGEVADVQSGGTPSRAAPEYWNGEIPWYSSGELNSHHTQAPNRLISKDGLDNSNAKLFPSGSLLIGMYDTAALKMSILDREAAFNQAVSGVRPNDTVDLTFVMHAINVQKVDILRLRRGVRQKNLSLKKIKAIAIPLPNVIDQRRVVDEINELWLHADEVESLFTRKLAALVELKQSILRKAFSGELTAEKEQTSQVSETCEV